MTEVEKLRVAEEIYQRIRDLRGEVTAKQEDPSNGFYEKLRLKAEEQGVTSALEEIEVWQEDNCSQALNSKCPKCKIKRRDCGCAAEGYPDEPEDYHPQR
jgi:hypothetical protein